MPAEAARPARVDSASASTLAVSVMRLARRLRQERDTDLTATQLSALGSIRRHGPLTIGALAAHERVQPPSMTRTVGCLVDRGLVTRSDHPLDGRQVVVCITDAGRDVVARTRRRRDAWLARRLAALPPGERATLAAASEILRRIADS